MTGTAKWLLLCSALVCGGASGDDVPRAASVAGVEVALDENGMPAAVDQLQRRQLIENLRASFAARGVAAQSGPLRISAEGVESMRVGLDRTAISLARVNESCQLELLCVHGDEHAAEFLSQGAAQ